MRYLIVMENETSGELDRKEVRTEAKLKSALLDFIDQHEVSPGDVFRVIDQEG